MRKTMPVGLIAVAAAAGVGWHLYGERLTELHEAQALMQPCSDIVRNAGSYHLSEILVGQREDACTRWTGGPSGAIAGTGTVRLGKAGLPLVVYQHKATGTAFDAIYVRGVGGPGESIAPAEGDRRYLDLLGTHDLLVSIGYTGTRYRTLYPKPDYQAACEDVAAYLDGLRVRNPDARLIVIGESLGGQIVAGALHRTSHVDAVVLVNPMMFSPEQARRNFAGVLRHTYDHDTKVSVRRLASRDERWVDGHRTSEYTIDLFRAFF